MTLSPSNQARLAHAASTHVTGSLASIARFAKENRWLGKGNRYSTKTVARIKSDIGAGTLNARHLAQYIAVSTLLHATDGWGYLGRSIQSILHGDAHRALHLGYYAELRAAMSLLASQGVGIFKNQHFVVDATNSVSRFPQSSPTHEFAWDALSHWAQLNTSGALLAQVVRPHGRPLDEWLRPSGGGSTFEPQAKAWFRQWGMDLGIMGDDRNARNVRSYRPTDLPEPWVIDATEALRFVTELWSLLEPGASPSELLDRHILRLSIESLYKSRRGHTANVNGRDYTNFVSGIVNHQALSAILANQWIDFLLRRTAPEDPSAIAYSRIRPLDDVGDVFGLVSRATLLLRVATGATDRLFEEAGLRALSIDFWRQDLGKVRGFWNEGAQPNAMADLWTDIADATTEADPFLRQLSADQRSFRNLALQFSQSLGTLGGCERAVLWGVLPTS